MHHARLPRDAGEADAPLLLVHQVVALPRWLGVAPWDSQGGVLKLCVSLVTLCPCVQASLAAVQPSLTRGLVAVLSAAEHAHQAMLAGATSELGPGRTALYALSGNGLQPRLGDACLQVVWQREARATITLTRLP